MPCKGAPFISRYREFGIVYRGMTQANVAQEVGVSVETTKIFVARDLKVESL